MAFAITVTSLTACTNNNTQSKNTDTKTVDTTQSAMQVNNTDAINPAAADAVVTGYLNIKNALAKLS